MTKVFSEESQPPLALFSGAEVRKTNDEFYPYRAGTAPRADCRETEWSAYGGGADADISAKDLTADGGSKDNICIIHWKDQWPKCNRRKTHRSILRSAGRKSIT